MLDKIPEDDRDDVFEANIVEYNFSQGIPVRTLPIGVVVERKNAINNPHGSPTLTLDPEGYLHATYGANYGPIQYRKSIHSLFTHPLSWGEEEVIANNLTSSVDHWTYQTMHADDKGDIHLAASIYKGSLSTKSGGYIKRTDGVWNYPLAENDPLGNFSVPSIDANKVRYNVMMNLDEDYNPFMVLPFLTLGDNGYMPAEGVFNEISAFQGSAPPIQYQELPTPWFTPSQSTGINFSKGTGNVQVDPKGLAHFLQMGGVEVQEQNLVHIYQTPAGTWEKEYLYVPGELIHRAALRIDNYGGIFVFFYTGPGDLNNGKIKNWVYASPAQPQKLYLAYKHVNDADEAFQIFAMPPGNPALTHRWWPAIEEQQRFGNLDKNWFHILWQEALGIQERTYDTTWINVSDTAFFEPIVINGVDAPDKSMHITVRWEIDEIIVNEHRQMVYGRTLTPYREIDFSGHSLDSTVDLRTTAFISAGTPTQTEDQIVRSTGNVTFTAGEKIRLLPGFGVKAGGHFQARIDTSLEFPYPQVGQSTPTPNPTLLARPVADSHPEATARDIEENLGDISLYPNPARQYVTVQLPPDLDSTQNILSIFTLNGRLVYQQKLEHATVRLTLSDEVPTGLYLVKVTGPTFSMTKPLLIQK